MTIDDISEKLERLESTIEEIVSRGHSLQDENEVLFFDENIEIESLYESYDTQITDIQLALDRLETLGLDKFVIENEYRVGSEVLNNTIIVVGDSEPQVDLYKPHKVVDDIRWFLTRIRNIQSTNDLTSDYDPDTRTLRIGDTSITFRQNTKTVQLLEIISNLAVNTSEENLDICQKLYGDVGDLWSKEEKKIYWQRLSKTCRRINERVRAQTARPELNYLVCDYYETKRII